LQKHQENNKNCEKATKIEEKRWVAEWLSFLAENFAKKGLESCSCRVLTWKSGTVGHR
jgi:hypothetical protein